MSFKIHMLCRRNPEFLKYAVICITSLIENAYINPRDIILSLDKESKANKKYYDQFLKTGCEEIDNDMRFKFYNVDKIFKKYPDHDVIQIDCDCYLSKKIDMVRLVFDFKKYYISSIPNTIIDKKLIFTNKARRGKLYIGPYCPDKDSNHEHFQNYINYLHDHFIINHEDFFYWLDTNTTTWECGAFMILRNDIVKTDFWKLLVEYDAICSDDESGLQIAKYKYPNIEVKIINSNEFESIFVTQDLIYNIQHKKTLLHYAGLKPKSVCAKEIDLLFENCSMIDYSKFILPEFCNKKIYTISLNFGKDVAAASRMVWYLDGYLRCHGYKTENIHMSNYKYDEKITDKRIIDDIPDITEDKSSNIKKIGASLMYASCEKKKEFWKLPNIGGPIFDLKCDIIYNKWFPMIDNNSQVLCNEYFWRMNYHVMKPLSKIFKEKQCKVIHYVHSDLSSLVLYVSRNIKNSNPDLSIDDCKKAAREFLRDMIIGYDIKWIAISEYVKKSIEFLLMDLKINSKNIHMIYHGKEIDEHLKMSSKNLDYILDNVIHYDCVLYDVDSCNPYPDTMINLLTKLSATKNVCVLRHNSTNLKIDNVTFLNISKDLNLDWIDKQTIHDFMLISDFHFNYMTEEEFGFIPLEFSLLRKNCYLPIKASFPEFKNRPYTFLYNSIDEIINLICIDIENGKNFRSFIKYNCMDRYFEEVLKVIQK